MNVGLALIGDIPIDRTDVVLDLSDQLYHFFKNRNYGTGVKTFTIGVVCTSPQFEPFFRGKRPKYTKGKKQIIQDGEPFKLEDDFEYQFKLDFNKFTLATKIEATQMVKLAIVNSTYSVEDLVRNINSFDADAFFKDLRYFLRSS